jgi:glucose-6-phosphate dehydrogenase assembly protein OpcA
MTEMTPEPTPAVPPEDLRVDAGSIEKSLSELWRVNKAEGHDEAVMRAALWNVIAHTWDSKSHTQASEALCMVAEHVPQRTIIIRAGWSDAPDLTAWIGANCHLVGGNKQVCSEEIDIVAGGERIHHVPPLVNALLIPDMPVAFWWLGDLPHENEEYVQTLLAPADRLIVDSSYFDNPADLALVSKVAAETFTAPADLNFVRLEEWRVATASIFDPPAMRRRLGMITRVRVVASISSEEPYFGEMVEAILYGAWLAVQAGYNVDRDGRITGPSGPIDYRFDKRLQSNAGGVAYVEISFDDGSSASITRHRERGVLVATVDGVERTPDSVTRTLACEQHELIVRLLKQPEADRVLVKVLPVATRLAKRLAR